LKAFHCVRGKELLYGYAASRSIGHRRLGKMIVATSEDELCYLADYITAASANGVDDLRFLSQAEITRMEPDISVAGAVFSPSTGIIDSHALMLSLLGDFENAGGSFIPCAKVLGGMSEVDGVKLRLDDAEQTLVSSKVVINSAGLNACEVALSIEGIHRNSIPKAHYAIGHYFTMVGRNPFSHLIYPVAGHGHLGIHVTLDMANQVRFGPDIQWLDAVNYTFDESRKDDFVNAVARYYPAVRSREVTPAYTGIRPKISGPHEPPADFLIQQAQAHGVVGLVNLLGIESPGLTSALSLAKSVREIVS
jgi:L-2-hydroxyglutarate oxidase LhgO